MRNNQKEWLPHLQSCMPEKLPSGKISMYTIALEGWRRGLKLKLYNELFEGKMVINYSLSNKEKECHFAVSKGPEVTEETRKISRSKTKTKKYLELANIPVASGANFNDKKSDEEIIRYADELGYPVVLKPTDGKLGKGVIVNISDADELKDALTYVRKRLKHDEVILEKYVEGDEVRVYVLDGKVLAAMKRIPANIIADGKHSIKQLIINRNKERKRNPNLRTRPIKIDNEVRKYIRKSGYEMDSIPAVNEQIFLRRNSNLSSGGEPIDVTDELTAYIKGIAVNTTKAIPGMVQGGVDMIINGDTVTVIEVNSKPGIGGHLFPEKGCAKNIPKAIIDYYFPETMNNAIHQEIYFDYPFFADTLRSGQAEEVILPELPRHLSVQAFSVTGKVQKVGYRRWVQRKAMNLELSGFVENRADGSVFIVAAGDESNMFNFEAVLNSESPRRAQVQEVSGKPWRKPVQLGFQVIKEEISEQKAAEKNSIINKQKKQIKQLQLDLEQLQNHQRYDSASKLSKFISRLVKK